MLIQLWLRVIRGVKVVSHLSAVDNTLNADDLPYRLEVEFTPPQRSLLSFVAMNGNERIVAKGRTRTALRWLVANQKWEAHPRFLRYEITGTK